MRDFDVLLFDGLGNPLGKLSTRSRGDNELRSCVRSEEINGEHSLTVETVRHLDVGTRALTRDTSGRWREWVVDSPDESHDSGEHAVGSYHMVWSLQYDLQSVCGSIQQPGMASPTTAKNALISALDGTNRWKAGTVDVTTKSGALMAFDTAWDRLTTIVKRWGGEIDAEITVGETGVTSRKVALRQHLGSTTVRRRFEWAHNLTSIRRTPDTGPYFCRVIPLGNGDTEYADDDVTTFEWKLDISEVYGGRTYLRDTESEAVFRVSDGSGGYEYPTCIVEYSTDDPEELLAVAKEDLLTHTRPSVSYEATVEQFADAGMDVEGVSLGDEVQVVDMGFNPDAPLRVQERVIKVTVDELGKDDAQLTVGKFVPTLERTLTNMTQAIGEETVAKYVTQYETKNYYYQSPTLPTYTVTTPTSGTYTVPTTAPTVSDLSGTVAELTTRVSAIESATGVSPVYYEPSSGEYDGGVLIGDGWIHQINGVTVDSATVNFSTVSSVPDAIESGAEAAASALWGGGTSTNRRSNRGIVDTVIDSVKRKAAQWGSGS